MQMSVAPASGSVECLVGGSWCAVVCGVLCTRDQRKLLRKADKAPKSQGGSGKGLWCDCHCHSGGVARCFFELSRGLWFKMACGGWRRVCVTVCGVGALLSYFVAPPTPPGLPLRAWFPCAKIAKWASQLSQKKNHGQIEQYATKPVIGLLRRPRAPPSAAFVPGQPRGDMWASTGAGVCPGVLPRRLHLGQTRPFRLPVYMGEMFE